MDAERALHFAQAERERQALIALAAELAPVGVRLLVFKGIHLAFGIAREPERRLCLDADALIVEGTLERAGARIRALSRWKLHDENRSAHGVTLIETGAYIDLHRRALPPRWGRLDVGALRARASIMPDVFGPHVLAPDPLDAAVLAVANYTKDMLGSVGHGRLAEDLKLLEERAGVAPGPLAERLASHGLRRAGLLAFVDMARRDPYFAPYRAACSTSDVEEGALQLLARIVPPVAARAEPLAFMMVRGVGDDASTSALSLAMTAARLLRDRMRRR